MITLTKFKVHQGREWWSHLEDVSILFGAANDCGGRLGVG